MSILAKLRELRISNPENTERILPAEGTLVFSIRVVVMFTVAGILLALGIGLGMTTVFPVSSQLKSGSPAAEPVHYVNLIININSTTGWPQYSATNFSVPTGRVVFTIVDNDMVASWPGCPCIVRGTVGNVEEVNGTSVSVVPTWNIAHSFVVPDLGLSVWSPGQSVVRFTVDLVNPGEFTWVCIMPCGAGPNPYTSPPMETPGYMTGSLSVTG